MHGAKLLGEEETADGSTAVELRLRDEPPEEDWKGNHMTSVTTG